MSFSPDSPAHGLRLGINCCSHLKLTLEEFLVGQLAPRLAARHRATLAGRVRHLGTLLLLLREQREPLVHRCLQGLGVVAELVAQRAHELLALLREFALTDEAGEIRVVRTLGLSGRQCVNARQNLVETRIVWRFIDRDEIAILVVSALPPAPGTAVETAVVIVLILFGDEMQMLLRDPGEKCVLVIPNALCFLERLLGLRVRRLKLLVVLLPVVLLLGVSGLSL